ncbi:helicase SRCAP/SWR1, partial [Phenoliferia sp. Uapishka_3]
MPPRHAAMSAGTPVASTSGSAKGKGRASGPIAFTVAPEDVSMSDPTAATGAAPTHTEKEIQDWRTREIDARQAEVRFLGHVMGFETVELMWALRQQLAEIVDSHDDHVRELFHLDRFVTLIGFDPAVAKQDKSDVFLTFQHNYDLWTHAAPESSASGGGRRATRRAATDRKVSALPQAEAPSTPVPTKAPGSRVGMGHPHGKVDKGKGKAVAPASNGKAVAAESSEGEAVVVRKATKGKGRGRKSAPAALIKEEDGLSPVPPSRGKAGKRHSLAISTLPPDSPPLPTPSTSKHTIQPPSPNYPKRLKLAHDPSLGPTYSHPLQVPPRQTHGGSLSNLLGSYIVIDEEDVSLPLPPTISLSSRAKREASILTRVAAFRATGRTLGNPDRRPSNEPKRAKDHQDNLIDHVVYFSKLLNDERKSHMAVGKKISKMVLGHFANLHGKEEREMREIEKGQKVLAKWTAKEVRKKWKMAINVVKARRKAIERAERDRLGKEQLNAMLDKSTTMLQAQQVEMAVEDSESEVDSSDSDSSAEEEESDKGDQEDVDTATDEVATPLLAPGEGTDDTPAPTPTRRTRPPRSQSALSISISINSPAADSPAPSLKTPDVDPDPDLDDEIFEAPEDSVRANEDETWEAEMEAEEGEDDDSDSEMDGLADDADLPIEELRRRYALLEAAAEAEALEGGSEGEAASDDDAGNGEEDASMADITMAADEADRTTSPPATDEPSSAVPHPIPSLPTSAEPSNSPREAETVASVSTPNIVPDSVELTAEEQEAEAMSEFGSDGDENRDIEDEQLEEEMEAENSGSDDEEMNGLVDDADMPIEELMAKYGYGGGSANVAEQPESVAGSEDEASVTLPSDRVEDSREGSLEPKTNGITGTHSPIPLEAATPEEDDDGSGEEAEESSGAEESAEEGGEEEDENAVAERVHLRPPFLLRGSLRPYQQAGLEWLASLYSSGVNGILADEMGLGKTIQTISLLAHLACDKGQWGPHLVVVPTSVMLNWEMEFKKFLPGFKILTYYGTVKERKEKRRGWNTENAFHVCVTSYQLVLADQHMFRRKPWHYMILDEAHHIKNFRSQRWQTLLGFNARHRLLITGTPLQNNLMELWSLLYFLMPHGLTGDGGKGPFADHSDFQAWFSNPMEKAIENGESMDEETKATVSKLHTVLRPYLLRRLKSEVETQMPGKTESIIYCRLSKRQRFLYDDFMSRSQTRETLGSGHFLSIINCLMQLRKVCNHPDLFEVRPIVTSFAMTRSVPSDYETTELLIRKRLLDEQPIAKMDWSTLTLVRPALETTASSRAASSRLRLDAAPALRSLHEVPIDIDLSVEPPKDTRSIEGWRKHHVWSEHRSAVERLESMAATNTRRCTTAVPFFGQELLEMLSEPSRKMALLPVDVARNPRTSLGSSTFVPRLVKSLVARGHDADDLVSQFGFVTPKVKALDMARHALGGLSLSAIQEVEAEASVEILQRASAKLSVAFPDGSLLQYDCGKLQKLDELLRECKAGGHRVLIFTQMTKVLDILEIFLSFHGHRYLRLDGSTKIEERQIITERFNSNDRILAFISSTRSGGLGINLQGADTVIFYDSDWNPALDRQCQDRAHRIGQTREVRIWRFVTEHSIEENMLKKANQKRRLDEMVIAEGDFTTDYLQKLDWRDYLDESQLKELGVDESDQPVGGESAAEVRQALAAAEDEEDAAAARAAEGELQVDQSDFSEAGPAVTVSAVPPGSGAPTPVTGGNSGEGTATPMEIEPEEEAEVDPLAGTVDGYIVNFVDSHWEFFD